MVQSAGASEFYDTARTIGVILYEWAVWTALQVFWVMKSVEDVTKELLQSNQVRALEKRVYAELVFATHYVLAWLSMGQHYLNERFAGLKAQQPGLGSAWDRLSEFAVQALKVLFVTSKAALAQLNAFISSERVQMIRKESVSLGKHHLGQWTDPNTSAMFVKYAENVYEHRYTILVGFVVGSFLLLGPRKGLRVVLSPILLPLKLVWITILWTLGFRKPGVRKGSLAAKYQGRVYGGETPGKGMFAKGQRRGAVRS